MQVKPMYAFFLIALHWMIGCTGPAPESNEQAKPQPEPEVTLVVYSGRGAVLVDPLFAKFSEQSNIKVEVRYEKSTETLANRLVTEGAQTEADVFFAQDSGYLGALAAKGILSPLPESITNSISEKYRSRSNQWVATSGRARVLVYSPERVEPADLPESLADLADPKFKGRIGWAPQNASYQAHISALRAIWGEETTATWLKAMIAIEPKVYPKNSPQVKAVSNGEIDIGWVNHYYLHKLKAADSGLKAQNYNFRMLEDAGNLMMLSGAGVVSHSKHKEAAEKLLAFLVSESAQAYFAQDVYEYPTRPGIATHADVPPIEDKLVLIDQQALTDVGPTLTLLRELGLQ